MNNEFKKMQKLAGLIKENQINEASTTPSEKTWKLWLKVSEENGIEGYDIEDWNHIQVGNFLKELQWIEINKDKYSDEELSDEFTKYIEEMY